MNPRDRASKKPSKSRKVKGRVARKRAITPKVLAERWGDFAMRGMLGCPWYGDGGKAMTLSPIPIDQVARFGRQAGHYALLHRAKYPLKGA